MKTIPLTEVQTDLSKFLRMAEDEEIVMTDAGRPVGMLIGFDSDDDWSDVVLESDPRFLKRVAAARESLRQGKGVRLEDFAW